MMRKNNMVIIFGSLFFFCSVMVVNGMLVFIVVLMVNGGQVSIVISNISLNLFIVFGDWIIVVNSLDGVLINNEQIVFGGVVVVIVNKKFFMFILEIECGLNFFIQVVFCEGVGCIIQLVSDLCGIGEEVGVWEMFMFYEFLFVIISQVVCGGKLFVGWYQVLVIKEILQVLVGLFLVVDVVWMGNYLKMVCFVVENKMLFVLNIWESDFWQLGICVVMFSQFVSQLLVGVCMDVYVICDGEGN